MKFNQDDFICVPCVPTVIVPDTRGYTLQSSHHAQWSLDPWIELSSRFSACGWAPRLTQRWNSSSLEWRWGLCCCLSASDPGQNQGFGFLIVVAMLARILTFGASSCRWWASFLWRISDFLSRWEWVRQWTAEPWMDSAAAKCLDRADTHWPRESSGRTMSRHKRWSSVATVRNLTARGE